MSQIDNQDQSVELVNILERLNELSKKVAGHQQSMESDLDPDEIELELDATRQCPSCGSCCPSPECCSCCPPCECCPGRGISLADVMQALDDLNKTNR